MQKGNNQRRWLATGFFILILSGCASMTRENANHQLEQESVEVAEHCAALNYYEALSLMTEKELKQEQIMLRESLTQTKNSCDQLRLATLSCLPGMGMKNEKESEQILRDILKNDADLASQDRQFALLLTGQVQERKKIRSNQQSLKKQLKKERAASLSLLERLAEAQSKLKQLKNIDKNINEKEQEISTPSTDKIPHEKK